MVIEDEIVEESVDNSSSSQDTDEIVEETSDNFSAFYKDLNAIIEGAANGSSGNSAVNESPDCTDEEFFQCFINELIKEIPKDSEISIPNQASAELKIESFNEKSQNALLNAFEKDENSRLERQKPIMITVIILLATQLVGFNVLIYILVFRSFPIIVNDTGLFGEMLDFLKYYIGAVIVELVGLMITITRNTFSTRSGKIIERIMSFRKSDTQ